MKYSFVGVFVWGIVLLIGFVVIGGFVALLFFGIKALKKYLNTLSIELIECLIKAYSIN